MKKQQLILERKSQVISIHFNPEVHFFRESLLSLNEASQIATFLSSCAQLVDIQVLVTAARDFFQALPASLTLPVYPRHSAGEALLWEEGAAPIAADPSWGYLNSVLGGQPQEKSEAQQKLAQHATEQWRQCEACICLVKCVFPPRIKFCVILSNVLYYSIVLTGEEQLN